MKRQLLAIGACVVLLSILFLATDPNSLPSFFLIVPFIIIFIILYIALWLAIRNFVSRAKAIKVAALCASVPLLLLILQSIGQLTFRDVFTIVALFALAYFYISKTSVASHQ